MIARSVTLGVWMARRKDRIKSGNSLSGMSEKMFMCVFFSVQQKLISFIPEN